MDNNYIYGKVDCLMFGPCGINCETCYDYKSNCSGCRSTEGKAYWTSYSGLDVCPIYRCCTESRGHSSCGECSKLPCQLFYDTRDPAVSAEAHAADVLLRVGRLRTMAKKAE